MAKADTIQPAVNVIEERAIWLKTAADALRPDFEKCGLPLPEKIRFGFSTKGKGTNKTGECWHSEASGDGAYEIFIRADRAEPIEVIGILVRELVHAALPAENSHGKRFKAAALKIGLTGKMWHAVPGHLLAERLQILAESLGPLPHAQLDISWSPVVRAKRQVGRMLKATCPGFKDDDGLHKDCGYTIRLSAKWAKEYGASCPKHGPIPVEFSDPENGSEGAEPEPPLQPT